MSFRKQLLFLDLPTWLGVWAVLQNNTQPGVLLGLALLLLAAQLDVLTSYIPGDLVWVAGLTLVLQLLNGDVVMTLLGLVAMGVPLLIGRFLLPRYAKWRGLDAGASATPDASEGLLVYDDSALFLLGSFALFLTLLLTGSAYFATSTCGGLWPVVVLVTPVLTFAIGVWLFVQLRKTVARKIPLSDREEALPLFSGGDVDLFILLALTVSYQGLSSALFFCFLLAGFLIAMQLVLRRPLDSASLPFGPVLALSALLALALPVTCR